MTLPLVHFGLRPAAFSSAPSLIYLAAVSSCNLYRCTTSVKEGLTDEKRPATGRRARTQRHAGLPLLASNPPGLQIIRCLFPHPRRPSPPLSPTLSGQ